MLTAVVTGSGESLEVSFLGDHQFVEALVAAEEKEVPENDLNPIAIEMKELAWGFGSFVVMALVLRYLLYPKLKRGMDERAESMRREREAAEALTASARDDVAGYEAQVASLRSEAQQRVEVARATLEAERAERLAAANAEIADRRRCCHGRGRCRTRRRAGRRRDRGRRRRGTRSPSWRRVAPSISRRSRTRSARPWVRRWHSEPRCQSAGHRRIARSRSSSTSTTTDTSPPPIRSCRRSRRSSSVVRLR